MEYGLNLYPTRAECVLGEGSFPSDRWNRTWNLVEYLLSIRKRSVLFISIDLVEIDKHQGKF